MAMSQVEAIPIPAQGDAILEPGGYHIMLIDLVDPLTEGEMIEVSLEFETASPQTLMVPVMATGPMGMEMGGMEHGTDDDSEEMAPADEDDPEADG
jgi:copper(I)-binding protein